MESIRKEKRKGMSNPLETQGVERQYWWHNEYVYETCYFDYELINMDKEINGCCEKKSNVKPRFMREEMKYEELGARKMGRSTATEEPWDVLSV